MRLLAAILLVSLAACGDDASKSAITTTSFTTATAEDVSPGDTSVEEETLTATSDPTDVATTTVADTAVATEVADDVAEDVVGPQDTQPADIPTTIVRAPAAGDIAFSELMLDPVGRSDLEGEWLELASLTDSDTLDLATCWVEDADGHRFTLDAGLVRLRAGERFVIARSADAGVDPDLVQSIILMPNAAGRLSFGCGAATLDEVAWGVGWPLAPGRALHLAADPEDNDLAADACAATSIYDAAGPNRGTPGVVDLPCPPRDVTVDACALVAPSTMTLRAGDDTAFAKLAAVAWIDEAGATDLSAGNDPIPNLRGEVGLGIGALTWSAAMPDARALDAAHPDYDYWSAGIAELTVGTWTVSFRFSLDDGASWTTCGVATLTVVPSPCDPNPCSRAATASCEDDVAFTSPEVGACAVVDDAAACSWHVTRIDCATLGGHCAAGACVDVAGPPAPGMVIIDEIMKNPGVVDDSVGEWIELLNIGDETVQLAGCELTDDTTDHIDLSAPEDDVGALTLAPGAVVTLAAVRDAGRNGGIDAAIGWSELGVLALDNNNDAVLLSCADQLIDVVRYTTSFPSLSGRSMQLTPRKNDATWNDLASSWCFAQTATGVGTFPDYGTPGVLNPACPEAVERCRMVAAPEIEAVSGESFTVAIQLRHTGITDHSSGNDSDPLLRVEGGTGPSGYYPTWGGWTYVTAVPDPAWSDVTFPLEDQWLASIYADPDFDTRDVAGRVSVDGGLSWTSCDRDSGLAGADGSQDGYAPANASRLVVIPSDPCKPNPCTTPPANRCDPNGLVLYPAFGVCSGADDVASCDYTSARYDCDALQATCDADLGECVGAIGGPARGDLVMTEVMVSPRVVADFFGEWIELESLAAVPVNLDGCVLADSDGAVAIAVPGHALVAQPGERVVIARQATGNGGVDAAWTWGGALGLGNSGDKIELRCDGVVIDNIVWDASWPFAAGVAMQLSADAVDAALNDDVDVWCAASTPFGEGDLGTPGDVNADCP